MSIEINLEILKKLSSTVKYAKGEKIFIENTLIEDARVYYILTGSVVLRKKFTPIVKEEFIYKQGDFFGILEIYHLRKRITEAEALTDSEILVFNKVNFEKILISNMGVSLKVIRDLSNILRMANQKIKELPT